MSYRELENLTKIEMLVYWLRHNWSALLFLASVMVTCIYTYQHTLGQIEQNTKDIALIQERNKLADIEHKKLEDMLGQNSIDHMKITTNLEWLINNEKDKKGVK